MHCSKENSSVFVGGCVMKNRCPNRCKWTCLMTAWQLLNNLSHPDFSLHKLWLFTSIQTARSRASCLLFLHPEILNISCSPHEFKMEFSHLCSFSKSCQHVRWGGDSAAQREIITMTWFSWCALSQAGAVFCRSPPPLCGRAACTDWFPPVKSDDDSHWLIQNPVWPIIRTRLWTIQQQWQLFVFCNFLGKVGAEMSPVTVFSALVCYAHNLFAA